jgi:2-polyprenyl-3-methyl-5-hydroxy-6-metoxy-1,4-benzoquinol methylase
VSVTLEEHPVVGAPSDAQAFYDQMWKDYGHLDAVSPAAFHRRRVIVQLAKQHARQASRILDVGCGQGELLREISAALPSAQVHGADLSEQSLIDSRKRNPTFEIFELNITHERFAEQYSSRLGAFDFLVCSEVLEHIPDHALAARHLLQLLQPSGVAIVTVPGGKMSAFDRVIGHQRHYTRAKLESLLTDAGFEVVTVLAWGFPFHTFYRTAVRVAAGMTVSSEKQQGSNAGNGVVSRVLGGAYSLFGKVLKPLFYLNASSGGEQLIAVAKRRA